MIEKICILGSGAMARDIGVYCLKHGHEVTWLAGNNERRESLEREIAKNVRRLSKAAYQIPSYRVATLIENDIDTPEIVIECTSEELSRKKSSIRSIQHLLDRSAELLLLSVSSSILPSLIHPRCIGCHFFYPVELTGIAEVILPEAMEQSEIGKVTEWLGTIGVEVLVQTDKNAFAVNRLLLALQAESIRQMDLGIDAETVNDASRNELFPDGQLALIDSIGLDTVHAAVQNYVGRMPEHMKNDYLPLINGLKHALDLGKLGKKNKNGLLCGSKAGGKTCSDSVSATDSLHEMFLALGLHVCGQFIRSGEITGKDLDTALKAVFNSTKTYSECLEKFTTHKMNRLMGEWFRKTGAGYFAGTTEQKLV